MLFGKTKTITVTERDPKDAKEIERLERNISDLKHEQKLDLEKRDSKHELDLKEKEFELKHFKDEEVQKLRDELSTEKQSNAVLKKENEMLVKITDLNAGVIDVKELVGSLIKKLPSIDIKSLSVTAPAGKD